jgi:UDPglucose 6-dehydrogenase
MNGNIRKVAVVGLWHLGSVVSAGIASRGYNTVAFDPEESVIDALRSGTPPVAEPGLGELLSESMNGGTLSFTADLSSALRGADIVWVTFDTPVDDVDSADVETVVAQIEAIFPDLDDGATVLVSSQLPVGTTARLERSLGAARPGSRITVAYLPENLRLGAALDAFLSPERIVVGVRHERDRTRIAQLLTGITPNLIFVTPESAEVAKHALNAFLAACVTFTNEVATVCEAVGAHADEVERALRSDPRVGSKAYVRAGASFSGGTLARDVNYLRIAGSSHDVATPVFDAILESNAHHSAWARRVLDQELGSVRDREITVLGLTYKVDTDTLRRSAAVELCRDLVSSGAHVRVHDPEAGALDESLRVVRTADVRSALAGAHAVVLATPWPQYRGIATSQDLLAMADPRVVVDASAFLAGAIDRTSVRYRTVGRPSP